MKVGVGPMRQKKGELGRRQLMATCAAYDNNEIKACKGRSNEIYEDRGRV